MRQELLATNNGRPRIIIIDDLEWGLRLSCYGEPLACSVGYGALARLVPGRYAAIDGSLRGLGRCAGRGRRQQALTDGNDIVTILFKHDRAARLHRRKRKQTLCRVAGRTPRCSSRQVVNSDRSDRSLWFL